MTARVIFECDYRGHRWRLESSVLNGRTFANWRKWYDNSGEWEPTRQGCTFPMDKLWELTSALMDYHGLPAPDAMLRQE